MNLTIDELFSCPYCMAANEIEVDMINDLHEQLIVDCQICCQPIEIYITGSDEQIEIIAKTDSE